MRNRCRFDARMMLVAPGLATLLLVACGGGERPQDEVPSRVAPAPAAASGPDSFLLAPNPLVQPDGTLQSNTLAYAEAYYAAIDPANAKDTLDKWKAANRFDQSGGVQVSAVFGDFRDLGYGRRMTGRHNTDDNTIAFVVENYLVNPGSKAYGDAINLYAAIVEDRQWRASINAIEYSPGPGPGGTVRYAKFYSFDPATGARRLTQDLDSRGEKAMPGVCIVCHGGRVDPLEPVDPATGKPRFPLLQNSQAAQRGDTRGRMHVFEVDALTFADRPGFSRPEQQAALKAMNRMVLCSYPYNGAQPAALTEDQCRQPDTSGLEWQASAAGLIKDAYGGPGLPDAVYTTPPVPAGWSTQAALYRDVIAPACRNCHLVRGTGQQSDIDFATFAKFDGYAARHRYHVFERGNMPLAKIQFDSFWASTMPEQLAAYLQSKGDPALAPTRDADGALLPPGHPFSDPGPDRRVRLGNTVLSARASLFADAHQWTLVSGPNGATPPTGASLSGADTATPTFTASPAAVNQRYVVELVSSQGTVRSEPARLTLYVDAATDIDPAAIDLTRIKTLLGPTEANCVSCHSSTGTPPTAFTAATDELLHTRLRGQANLSDIAGSALLRKPAGRHHSSLGTRPGF
ncbi:MAG: hypothetical protein ABIQ60_07520, partial [Burkholderiaceae bacterium]